VIKGLEAVSIVMAMMLVALGIEVAHDEVQRRRYRCQNYKHVVSLFRSAFFPDARKK
jgi:hypothetical protein